MVHVPTNFKIRFDEKINRSILSYATSIDTTAQTDTQFKSKLGQESMGL